MLENHTYPSHFSIVNVEEHFITESLKKFEKLSSRSLSSLILHKVDYTALSYFNHLLCIIIISENVAIFPFF